MSTLAAALILLAAVAAVYVCCVRPMRRGGCAPASGAPHDIELRRQIANLREEVRILRAQDSLADRRAGHGTNDADT